MNNLNFILTLGLLFLDLSVGKFYWLKQIPERHWLSFGGGVAIAYVFIDILPSLQQAEMAIERSGEAIAISMMHQVYLLALIGLIIFYGLEMLAEMQSPKMKEAAINKKLPIPTVFWLHIGFSAISNALFSYLLNHTASTVECLLLFVAVAFQYTINDRNLRQHNPRGYDKIGRWLLAGAILTGWGLRLVIPMGEVAIALLKAFLAGGLILNVLKRELPDRSESCFWSFICGAGFYSSILLLL
ncbi:hypothetical protein [Merismopedia glauca]|uniref:Uncharacterized protein n=1 Tax=Merismopedia glauca CCAP 1448/3 TaxID=1296344 RepID=A0A2T1BYW3_9CYAN|nr:hypothetical protein [Merismopedia glauca]PSB01225.1 hypothetical protein C7B64_19435 [Merismopedia glauca CCAP 1448/3]